MIQLSTNETARELIYFNCCLLLSYLLLLASRRRNRTDTARAWYISATRVSVGTPPIPSLVWQIGLIVMSDSADRTFLLHPVPVGSIPGKAGGGTLTLPYVSDLLCHVMARVRVYRTVRSKNGNISILTPFLETPIANKPTNQQG